MRAYYKEPLPKIESVQASFPNEFSQLDVLTSTKDLEAFGAKARGLAETSEAWRQVSRYSAIREIQSCVKMPSTSVAGQYIEDCVAERVWMASKILSGIDTKTRQLLAKQGFLGGMIAQIKRPERFGRGNFIKLRDAKAVDCTAEYCVWKWGLGYVEQGLRDKLANLADSDSFDKR